MSSPASLVDIYPNFFEGLFSDDDDDHFDEVLQYPRHTNSVVVTNLDAAESTTTERKATDQENEGLELKRKQYSERLRQKIRELQELIPNSNKTDRPPALLLDDAINYFIYLNHQVQYVQYVHKMLSMLSMSRGPPFVPTIPLLGMGMRYPMHPLPESRHYQPLLPLAEGFNPVRGSYIADPPLTLDHLYQRGILHATQVVSPSNTTGNEDPVVIECGCGGGCVDGFPTCCCELCWSCDDDGDGDDGCSGGGDNGGDGDDGCNGGGNNGGCSRDDVQHRGV